MALKNARSTVVVLALSALAVAVIWAWNTSVPLEDAENWGYDELANSLTLKHEQPVVLIDFDDATLRSLKAFPVPRKVIAQLVDKVSTGKPKLIGLDLLLNDRRDEEGDAALTTALHEAGNVVIASQIESGQLPRDLPLERFCVPDYSQIPYCGSGSTLAVGFINLPVDDDGFIRRDYILPPTHDDKSLPFASVLASLLLQSPLMQAFERFGVPDGI